MKRFFISSCVSWLACQAHQDLGDPARGPDVQADAGLAEPEVLRAFVTSASFKGDLVAAAGGGLGGLAAADSLCQTAATGAGLEGAFVAYLSSDSDHAVERLVDEGPFHAVDGKTLLYKTAAAVGARALVEVPDESGKIPVDTHVGRDAWGQYKGSTSIASFWTGSSAAGKADGKDCRGWASSDLFDDGSSASYLGVDSIALACQNERHLLCLEQHAKPRVRPTKRVFITSGTVTGSIPGAAKSAGARADAVCQNSAASAHLKGAFHAWLAFVEDGEDVLAPSRHTKDARYVLLDGRQVFASVSEFKKGPEAPIEVTELGETVQLPDHARVWTGTASAAGIPAENATCANWASSNARDSGAAGFVRADEFWTKGIEVRCDAPGHLYCFEE